MGYSAAGRCIYLNRTHRSAAYIAKTVGECELSMTPTQAYMLLEFPNLHEAVHMRDRKELVEVHNKIDQLAAGSQKGPQPLTGSVSRV